MRNNLNTAFALLAICLCGFTAAGCGQSSGPASYYTETVYYPVPVPSPDSPPADPAAPVKPDDSDCCACPPELPTDTVAALSTASLSLVNEVLDWSNPTSPVRDAKDWELIGRYKLTSGEPELALRKLVITSDRDLPWLMVLVYNQSNGAYTWYNVPGAGRRFEVTSPSSVELGFCEQIGDRLSIQVMTDTRSLDGQQVALGIERVSVSVGQDPAADKISGMPPIVTVRIREQSRLTHSAILPRRVDARSSSMEVGVIELANTSAVHTNSVAEINFIRDLIPTGTSNLRLEIKGNSFPLVDSYGMLIATTTNGTLASLSPGERTTYRVLADTIASVTTHIAITANGVTTIVDHGTESFTIYESGARDENGWYFAQFAVDIDVQITASLLPLNPTTGLFNGRQVIKANLNAMTDVTMTGAAYTLMSSDTTLVGEYHLLLNSVEYGTVQAPVNALVINPFSTNTPSFLLANGTPTLFEMPLYLNGGGGGDSVQLTLNAVIDDTGRAHMLRLVGPPHTLQ